MPVMQVPFSQQNDLTKFVQLINEYASADAVNGKFVKDALAGRLGKVSSGERVVALFVSGRKMVEGSLTELQQRFQQEVDSHSANVHLKELQDGEWVTIRSRTLQR